MQRGGRFPVGVVDRRIVPQPNGTLGLAAAPDISSAATLRCGGLALAAMRSGIE
jgi:hypothetical protein